MRGGWQSGFAVLFLGCSGFAQAQVSANAALMSNYVYRGFSLSGEDPALSAGLDWGHESGAYAGAWSATLERGAEIDLYLGYALDFGRFGLDFGGSSYEYTQHSNFEGARREWYAGGWFGPVAATVYRGRNSERGMPYRYAEIGLIMEAGPVQFEGHIGQFDPDRGAPVEDGELSAQMAVGPVTLRAAVSRRDIDEDLQWSLSVIKIWTFDGARRRRDLETPQ